MNNRQRPNWRNIRRLRDKLHSMKETETRKFGMDEFIRILSNPRRMTQFTVQQLRDNGPECGSAGCLAGEAVIWLDSPDTRFNLMESGLRLDFIRVRERANSLLGLGRAESMWMFTGSWARYRNTDAYIPLRNIPRSLAVRYLTKVLKEHNVEVVVRISEGREKK